MWFMDKDRPSYKEIMFKSFVSGTFWALGTAIGAGIVLALLSIVLNKTSDLPFIGNIVRFVINQVNLYNR